MAMGVAAQSGTVQGRVEDAAQAPVAGATVVLRNKSTGTERSMVSDGEGRFTFDSPADASAYEIVVTSPGFGRTVRQFAAGSDLVVTLDPAQINEQVTVTAARTEVTTGETAV